MSKPITPEEAEKLKVSIIPPEVFDVFNELIARDLYDGRSIVNQNEAANLIANRLINNCPEYKNSEVGHVKVIIYKNHWMDIESAYRDVGWLVDYDKPGYNESYEATFEFKKKK